MRSFVQDLRFGARMLVRNPLTSGVALLILALGIGANTAIFSVISGVLLAPLPYPQPDRLMSIIDTAPSVGLPRFTASPANFHDWQVQNRTFSSLAAYNGTRYALTGGARPVSVQGAAVSGDFFATFAVEPPFGRLLGAADDRPGGELVAVVSYDLWQQQFGGDPGLVGRRILVDGRNRTVVGIAPRGFDAPDKSVLWVPLALDYLKASRGGHDLSVVGRLRPAVTVAQAQSDLSAVAARLEKLYPDSNAGWGVLIMPLAEQLVEEVKPALILLQRAVWVVLLIACANVANLLLARMGARGREIAVRTALGAGRRRLFRQVIAESVVLFTAGGLLSVLVAWAGVRLLLHGAAGALPRAETVGFDGRVLLYALAVSIGCGVVAGLVPAWAAVGERVQASLKEGGRSVAGGSRRLLRSGLVVAEVALAMSLLIAAGLLLRSFARLSDVHPGFEPHGVLTATLSLPKVKYASDPRLAQFYAELTARAGALPGVEHADVVNLLPLSGDEMVLGYSIEGRPQPRPTEVPHAQILIISPGALGALGIPLVAGRTFTAQDRVGTEEVVMINSTLARSRWPGESPLGRRLTFGNPNGPKPQWFTVVGVVGDVRAATLRREAGAQMYLPILQQPTNDAALLVRTRLRPADLVAPVRQVVAAIDRDLPLDRVQTLEAVVDSSLAQNRGKTLLIGIFGALALLLAAVGIYGLVSYTVVQRRQEIGIRVALGAGRGQVLGMVVGQGMALVAWGLGLGLVASILARKLVADQLYGVGAVDPVTYVAVAAALALVALIANLLPAARATRVDPLTALRTD